METRHSAPKVAVLHPKTTDQGWDHYRLLILMLIKLFCMYKTTGEVRDPYILAILFQKALFCMQKQEIRDGTHRDKLFWC